MAMAMTFMRGRKKLDNTYGWSYDGFFYCDGYAWGFSPSGKSYCAGKTEDLIKDHPLEVKEKRMRIRRKK